VADAEGISVVVPTRGRPAALARCLDALRCQTVPVEVVVAEDDAGRGPAAARNEGARRAGGSVVLFTDDDCVPAPDWAETLAAGCPEDGAAAGTTVAPDGANAFVRASQLLTSELQRLSALPDGSLWFAPTSNLAVSRALLDRVPFDESFPLAAGEDREWCARARASGALLRHRPEALVRHDQSLGAAGLWRQQLNYGRGAARHRAAGGDLAGAGVRRRLLGAAFRQGAGVGLLSVVAQLAVALGYLAGRAGR
jgi:GT2 family glycosyltransferase